MKKIFLAAALAAAIMLTGCSQNESPDESVTETTTSETEITTVSETETETEKVTETEKTETETEPEKEPEVGIAGDMPAGRKLYNSLTGGFISYDREDVSRLIADAGIDVKNLAANIGRTDEDQCMYKFAMINDEPAEGVDAGDETVFCSTLFLGGDAYFVLFGTSETSTLDDVRLYCAENKLVEYWAFAYVDDNGVITLLPFIAGSEDSGYYAVIPVFEFIGKDVSGMEYPDRPLGTDYDHDIAREELTDGKFNIKLTYVDNMDSMVRVDCEVTNTYSFDAIISGKTVTVNGEDFSDSATVYFEVKSGETLTDEFFYINDCRLKEGDVLFISANLMDGNTYEEIGEITFELEL